ncbi:8-oxo-dGTP diphosphatase MutT [Zhongshania marina]|uniref:8-oxo-dGTP diphosphatase n=1 Tax=Zhongshania marina TaxID=2304603 RepID=A0ABX9W271_9GAMM|nr:8-oxo-dGTP diphosphatase MutT [Zhongshania marina]
MQNTAANKRVHVAVGVIFNSQGQILIARRHDDAHQGGLWEFPGGKVESDESVCDALARELYEELGINIQTSSCKPFIEIRHDYSDKVVLLDVWTVFEFDGEASGKEGQPLRWVDRSQLSGYDFPAANIAIIDAILNFA